MSHRQGSHLLHDQADGRICAYIPRYLRKSLFPMHRDLRLAGLLPPLDCPHHLRFEDESPYREGVTVDAPSWTGGAGKKPKGASTTWVNVGLRDPIEAEFTGGDVQAGMRVTVKMPPHGRGHGASGAKYSACGV